MIKVPLADIITKIKEETKLSDEDIGKRIDEKLEQLSGLVSKEGAAHIIANELGIKVLEHVAGRLQIKNILAGMRDVETVGRIQQIFDAREFQSGERKGKVGSFVLGDETGFIRIVCWGATADNIVNLKEGDVIKVVSGYVRENSGRKEVHLNERSKLIINPPGEIVGEVKQSITRKEIKDLREEDERAEILGTIVQLFDPRFFEVCPECGKRARQMDGKFICDEHNEIIPSHSYVFNAFLDDGTETIRVVFFRNQANNLLKMPEEEILKFRENPEKFEEIKTSLLGNLIKIEGRVKKNDVFNRLELVAQMVFLSPHPEEEIKRLNDEIGKVEEKKGLPTIEQI